MSSDDKNNKLASTCKKIYLETFVYFSFLFSPFG